MITKKTVIAFLVCLLLLGGGVFGVAYLKNRPAPQTETDVDEIQVVPTVEEKPTAIPTPKLDREELTLEILNGSGTPGLAGEAQEFLEELGYENIKTGNADSYNYESTEVLVKSDKEKYLDLILEDLKEDYIVGTSSADLDEDYTSDVQIILGKE